MEEQAKSTGPRWPGLLLALLVGMGTLAPAARAAGTWVPSRRTIPSPQQTDLQAAPASSAETTRTIDVDSIADDDPTGGCTLREAIDQANFDLIVGVNGCSITEGGSGAPATYVVNLPAYTYTLSGAAWDDNNFSGDLDIRANVTFQGMSAEDTVIDGGDNDRVFHIDPDGVGGLTVSFSDLTIRNGWVSGNGGGIHNSGDNTLNIRDCAVSSNDAAVTGSVSGGGIYCYGGVVNLTDSLISDNQAASGPGRTSHGGGISASTCNLNVTDSTIHNNWAYASSGAASAALGGGIYGLASTLNITGTTITDNSATGPPGGDVLGRGGGVYAYQSPLSITAGSTVSGNHAQDNGGGIGGSGTRMLVSASFVRGNSAEEGGGIWNSGSLIALSAGAVSGNTATHGGGIYLADAQLSVAEKCSLYDNQASGSGGGIYVEPGGELTMDGSAITGNTAGRHGGGLYADHATITMNTSAITSNSTTETHGGGIYCALGAVTLSDSTVAGNRGARFGGGIYSDGSSPGGTLALDGCTLSGNTAGAGGGIYLYYSPASLTNTTFSANAATASNGGGIGAMSDSPFTVELLHCTLTANTAATHGGGARFEPSFTVNVSNTIVAGNSAAGTGPDIAGTINSQDHNLIQDTSGTTIGGTTTHNITGQDPRLGPLESNGGETRTHALLDGSPAIDAIPEDACPLPNDQRGVTRPQLDGCDIGAYEAELLRVFLPLVQRDYD